jgi:adenosylhomocysteine nucleosidase
MKEIMRILLATPIAPEYRMCKKILGLKNELRHKTWITASAENALYTLAAVQSGPGKSKAFAATAAVIADFSPDIILDTGSCAGIKPEVRIGDIIMGTQCVEYGISGFCFFKKIYKINILPSAFTFFPKATEKTLVQSALQIGRDIGCKVEKGIQASGEHIINSRRRRESLHTLFHAAGGNWETAGVYESALRASLPVFSIRVVTDLGKANAIKEFYFNIKPCTNYLYRYISALVQENWFNRFLKAVAETGK